MMRNRGPFTRRIALALALLTWLGQIPLPLAAGGPDTLAIVGPSHLDTEAAGTWAEISHSVRNDPLLLVKDDKKVLSLLDSWIDKSAAIRESELAASIAQRGNAARFLNLAWDSYYSFDYEPVPRLLGKARLALAGVGDPSERTDMLFEASVLEGMSLKAQGVPGYRERMRRAASLRPGADLPGDRYSPEIKRAFEKARKEVLTGPRGSLNVRGVPEAASVAMDGIELGGAPLAGFEVLPGEHLLEIRSKGYDSWREIVEIGEWESSTITYQLHPSAPTRPVDSFFRELMESGDTATLKNLAARLGVGNLLLVSARSGAVDAWLVDGEGAVRGHETVWEKGVTPDVSAGKLAALVSGLRAQRSALLPGREIPLNLPAINPDEDGPLEEEKVKGPRWYTLLGVAVLVLVAAGGSGGGGGTNVEVSW